MKDMGLFLRGVKTKLKNNGDDYYGIIRECTAQSIPSAIIEHCHVDEVVIPLIARPKRIGNVSAERMHYPLPDILDYPAQVLG